MTATIKKEFADDVCEHIKERFPEHPKNKGHNVQQMFEKRDWDTFSDGERRGIGQTVSLLVKSHALPLAYAGKVKGNTQTYQVI
jgi:hypothetical protein